MRIERASTSPSRRDRSLARLSASTSFLVPRLSSSCARRDRVLTVGSAPAGLPVLSVPAAGGAKRATAPWLGEVSSRTVGLRLH
jgi:hypothetical protein